MSDAIVLLPQPDRPTKAILFPGFKCKFKPFIKGSPRYENFIFSNIISPFGRSFGRKPPVNKMDEVQHKINF